MKNGLYGVTFSVGGQTGAGVLYLENGTLRGGDSGSYYLGKYDVEGGSFTANVSVRTHHADPTMHFILGTEGGAVNLTGTSTDDSAHAAGTSPKLPGITFDCRLRWLSD